MDAMDWLLDSDPAIRWQVMRRSTTLRGIRVLRWAEGPGAGRAAG